MVLIGPRSHYGYWAFLLVIVVTVGSAGRPATAQTPPPAPEETPSFQLPEVIVPGKRPQPPGSTPASVSVLTKADLDRLGVLTVGEALQFLPEVQIRLQGALGALSLPSIRGSSPNQVLVLLDGVPVNSSMQGLFDLSTLSTTAVQRVEVLRGPFSAVYGGGALGGVINVVTTDEPGVGLSARGGGFATIGGAARWSTADGRVVVTADRFASDGARPNSDVTSTTVAGAAKWETSIGDVMTLRANHFRSSLGVPGTTAFPSPAARQDETRTIVSTKWGRHGDDGAWTVHAYWWSDDFRFDPGSATDSRTANQVFGTTVQRVLRFGPDQVWVFGAEAQSQALANNGSVGSRQATVGGVYVQDEQQLTPSTLLSAGLRYDVHSIYGGQVNPRLGWVVVIREDLTLRVGVGHTFRGPTFSELYFTPYNNPNLRPESAWSADVGLVWRTPSGAEVRTSFFGTAAVDLIRLNASLIPQNVGRATMTGGSVELAWPSAPSLGGALNVTVTRAVDDSTGTQLLRVPWVTAAASLYVPVSGGTLSVLATYVGSRLDVDSAAFTTILMPGYIVTGLRFATGTQDTGQWQLGVDNLGGLQYEPIAGFPAPGRTAFVSFVRSF
jgi:outer membrane cobalamin receptor